MLLYALKQNEFLSLSFGLTTIPTSFCGRSVLTLKFEFLSIIWLFPSFYLRLLQIGASKYLTQCWNMCVLPLFLLLTWLLRQLVRLVRMVVKLGFYRLVWLVASCLSLLVLKYKDISHFMLRSVPFPQPLRLVVLVAICHILSLLFCFLGPLLRSLLLSDGECVSTFAWWVYWTLSKTGVTRFH